jgi:hypothetical protein
VAILSTGRLYSRIPLANNRLGSLLGSFTSRILREEIIMFDNENDGGVQYFQTVEQENPTQLCSLLAALVRAKKEFEPAIKNSKNPHFNKKYADLGACLDAVNYPLLRNGIAIIQASHPCNDGVIIETIFAHESGAMLPCGQVHVPADKNSAQAFGSAMTYARRYSLMAACGIAGEDDDGSEASKPVQMPVKAAAAPAPKILMMPAKELADYTIMLNDAQTMEDLKALYIDCYKAAVSYGDMDALTTLTAAKESRKTTLENQDA